MELRLSSQSVAVAASQSWPGFWCQITPRLALPSRWFCSVVNASRSPSRSKSCRAKRLYLLPTGPEISVGRQTGSKTDSSWGRQATPDSGALAEACDSTTSSRRSASTSPSATPLDLPTSAGSAKPVREQAGRQGAKGESGPMRTAIGQEERKRKRGPGERHGVKQDRPGNCVPSGTSIPAPTSLRTVSPTTERTLDRVTAGAMGSVGRSNQRRPGAKRCPHGDCTASSGPPRIRGSSQNGEILPCVVPHDDCCTTSGQRQE